MSVGLIGDEQNNSLALETANLELSTSVKAGIEEIKKTLDTVLMDGDFALCISGAYLYV